MAIAPLTAAAKTTKAKKTTIACTAYLTEVHGNVLKGADKGPISCASPLGDGTQSDTFKMKFNKAKTGGTGLVTFKDKFKGGTVSGTWKLTFKISGPAVTIAFHAKYTGGTGKFKGITGAGQGGGGLSSEKTGSFQLAVKAVVPGAKVAKTPKPKVVGHMYSQSNGLTGNEIVTWNRYSNGNVKLGGTVSTGGIGAAQQQPGCTATCPQLDTDYEVQMTPDRKLLFAVNAGSNTISAFRIGAGGSLTLAGQTSSDGVFPFSLTIHGNELYVLNTDSTSIAGFTFDSTGAMTPIAGSIQKLTSDATPGFSRQIGFDNTGKVLIVTLLLAPDIDTFAVNAAGVAGPASEVASQNPFPFGFIFNKANQLVDSEVTSMTGEGSTATYSVTSSGSLAPIDNKSSFGALPCWSLVSPNQKFAFVVNTGNGAPPGSTMASYTISASGKLKFLGVSLPQKNEYLKTDEFITPNGKYLYVIGHHSTSSAGPATDSYLDKYKIASNGVLVPLGSTSAAGVPLGTNGLVGF
jgi:6-phosphogluconolactonase (cycloisomerase 2 family)